MGWGVLPALVATATVWLAEPTGGPAVHPEEYQARVLAASAEGEQAIAGFRIPAGFTVELFAAEPQVANPVAFWIDPQHRFYVVETFRLSDGVTDTRGHMNWLDDDLASRTVADRAVKYRKWMPKQAASMAVDHDRVRVIWDANDDGRADHAVVYTTGYNDIVEGLMAGVLKVDQDLYLTCIPNLWKLRDTNGDQVADEVQSLSTGYGIHTGFLGHDLHGLILGPDGRLYFSIGDRGLNVVNQEGDRLFYPDTGCVLRCELDGSHLEVFAYGLRNPQELAFDEFGNLFTVDNNSDSGDRARIVQLVEGGDSGWRIGYQFHDIPGSRGPWNAEQLWVPPRSPEQFHAAYIIPPIANYSDGPSGLVYYPGTGFPERYNQYFFLCDYRGTPANSGIRAFKLKAQGFGFQLAQEEEFLWQTLPTDVDFGADSAMYLADWVQGWGKTGKGRIYRVRPTDPTVLSDVQQTQALLQMLDSGKPTTWSEQIALLNHRDQRVRLAAQRQLVKQGAQQVPQLAEALHSTGELFPSLHLIWALGQLGRQAKYAGDRETEQRVTAALVQNLSQPTAEVRAQAAHMLAELAVAAAAPHLLPLLQDDNPRVQYYAAAALGRLPATSDQSAAVAGLEELARRNAERDPYLRHVVALALSRLLQPQALQAYAKQESASLRLAAVLALRRQRSTAVAEFLNDADLRVVAEAARAINDERIESALPALADLLAFDDPKVEQRLLELPETVLYRAIHANFRAGTLDAANRLAALARFKKIPERVRQEALDALGDWEQPDSKDRVQGLWWPVTTARAPQAAWLALLPVTSELLTTGPDRLRQRTAELLGTIPQPPTWPASLIQTSMQVILDQQRPAELRVAALESFAKKETAELATILSAVVADPNERVRTAGYRLLAKQAPTTTLPILKQILQAGSTNEKQGVIKTLAEMKHPEADRTLVELMGQVLTQQVAPELQLDVLEAAKARATSELQDLLTAYEQQLDQNDPNQRYRITLTGGDATAGKQIFYDKKEVYCVRCHKIDEQGGEVGPDLSKIGQTKDRNYLLESIILPSKAIAEGYDNWIFALEDGTIVAGVLKKETETHFEIITAEAKLLQVPKSEIEERRRGQSAMPETLLKELSLREIRDLVEYLANRKG